MSRTSEHAASGTAQATAGEAGAHALALRLLTTKARTRSELAAALRRRGVAEPEAVAVLARLEQVGLVDDEAVGGAYARRRAAQGVAAAAVTAELRARGLDAGLAARLAAAASPAEAEAQACRRAAVARAAQLGALPAAARARRLTGYLARRGYPADLVQGVVHDLVPEAGISGIADAGESEASSPGS